MLKVEAMSAEYQSLRATTQESQKAIVDLTRRLDLSQETIHRLIRRLDRMEAENYHLRARVDTQKDINNDIEAAIRICKDEWQRLLEELEMSVRQAWESST